MFAPTLWQAKNPISICHRAASNVAVAWFHKALWIRVDIRMGLSLSSYALGERHIYHGRIEPV